MVGLVIEDKYVFSSMHLPKDFPYVRLVAQSSALIHASPLADLYLGFPIQLVPVAVWNHAVYSKNRQRLLNEEIAEGFFQRVLERAKPYMSDEHFTVDGTLIEAWASHKVSDQRTGPESLPEREEMSTFAGKSERTRPMNRPLIRMPDYSPSPAEARPS